MVQQFEGSPRLIWKLFPLQATWSNGEMTEVGKRFREIQEFHRQVCANRNREVNLFLILTTPCQSQRQNGNCQITNKILIRSSQQQAQPHATSQ